MASNIKSYDFKGKKAIVRVDFNVPIQVARLQMTPVSVVLSLHLNSFLRKVVRLSLCPTWANLREKLNRNFLFLR